MKTGWGAVARQTTPRRDGLPSASAKNPRASVYSLPFVLVLTYLLIDYGRPQDWVPVLGVIKPGMLVLGGGVLALIICRAFPSNPLVKYMLAFLGLMVVQIPFAFNPHRAFNQTWDFALLLFGAILPIMVFVDSFERLRILLRFWIWIHVALALFSITHRGQGVGSFLGDENDFALAMNIALPYGFGLLMVERGTVRKLFLLGASLLFLLPITSPAAGSGNTSRGGFIGLVCVAIALWFRSQKKMLSLAIVLTLAMGFLAVAPPSFLKEMGTIETADSEDDTGHQRLYFWGIAWRMFLARPLGVGPGNYGVNAPNYESTHELRRGQHVWGRVAHSLYFTLLPENGFIGTALFAAMVILGVRVRRRLSRRCRTHLKNATLSDEDRERTQWLLQISYCMDVSLVGFLSTGAFISVLYYPHIWVLTALTVVTAQIASRHLPEEVTLQPAPISRSAGAAGRSRQRQWQRA